MGSLQIRWSSGLLTFPHVFLSSGGHFCSPANTHPEYTPVKGTSTCVLPYGRTWCTDTLTGVCQGLTDSVPRPLFHYVLLLIVLCIVRVVIA